MMIFATDQVAAIIQKPTVFTPGRRVDHALSLKEIYYIESQSEPITSDYSQKSKA
jgi:hypothetical protein